MVIGKSLIVYFLELADEAADIVAEFGIQRVFVADFIHRELLAHIDEAAGKGADIA